MDGQVQLLKHAEKDEVEHEVIRAYFVGLALRLPSTSRTQVALEEELGACIPTVFQENIVYIFCDAVRIWRDHEDCVLHTPQRNNNVNISSMHQYIPAHTSTYQYILVCTGMY
jgi:hypothetical protein